MGKLRRAGMICLSALCTAALFAAALVFQRALPLPAVSAVPLLGAGLVCFAAVIVFGYGEIKPRAPKREKAKARAAQAALEDADGAAEAAGERERRRTPPRRSTGTLMLFDDDVPSVTDTAPDATGEPVRSGLRLSWYAEGGKRRAELYSFPATLGRDPSCHAAVRAPGVSRRHAEITRINGAYYLTDLGSSNGSAVNGAEVTGAARIEDGGSIELGVTPVSVEFI